MAEKKVTLVLTNDRIEVNPLNRDLKEGDTVVWHVVNARANDTVTIGGFREADVDDFGPNPTVLNKGKSPFPPNASYKGIGPGKIHSDKATDEKGAYKYWVKWETKFVDGDTTVEKTITMDPWIWLI